MHLPGISLLFIDSTWWLRKSGKNVAKVNQHIEKFLAQHKADYPDNIIMLASHHPIKSIGPHGNLGKLDECIKDKECKHRKVGEIAHPVSQKAIKTLTQQLSGMDKVIYALSDIGFMVLDVYQNSSELKVYTSKKGQVVFKKILFSH